MPQAKKRILSVTVKRIVDMSPDTSYLGKYANRPTSEFSIDRLHTEDCASLEVNHRGAVDKLERIINSLRTYEDEEAIETLIDLQDQCVECDCGESGGMKRFEYRYFNPSFNYVDNKGNALPGNTAEEIRKYVREDYKRMEDLNRGDWCYLGIRVEADVILRVDDASGSSIIQTVTSGGLWGIESDSGNKYFDEVARDEWAELKKELTVLGFSARAMAKAWKGRTEKDA